MKSTSVAQGYDRRRTPSDQYTLEYVEVIQRHHKRTPYASNTFFVEDIEWSCDGSGPVFGSVYPNGQQISGAEVQLQLSRLTTYQNPHYLSGKPTPMPKILGLPASDPDSTEAPVSFRN